MTDSLRRIHQYTQQATEGPWEWQPKTRPTERVTALRSTTAHYYDEYPGVKVCILKALDLNGYKQANADFIANARADIPLLLNIAEKAHQLKHADDNNPTIRRELEALYEALDQLP